MKAVAVRGLKKSRRAPRGARFSLLRGSALQRIKQVAPGETCHALHVEFASAFPEPTSPLSPSGPVLQTGQ